MLGKDLALQVLPLPMSAKCLLGGHQLSSMLMLDITYTLNKMKAIEASSRSLIEMVSWLNWWMVTVQDMTSSTQAEDVVKIHLLFKAGGKAMVNGQCCYGELDLMCLEVT